MLISSGESQIARVATMLAAGSVLSNGLIVPSVPPPQTQVNVQAMGYAHVL